MLSIGDIVKLKKSNLSGVIVSTSCSHVTIKIGNIKVNTLKENVIKENGTHKANVPKTNIDFTLNVSSLFNNELMLRHQTKDEALDNLDRFINQAIVNKASIIKIVHGKHGGILRNAVHEYLKESKYISSFRLGYIHEGSYGVTIAYLAK